MLREMSRHIWEVSQWFMVLFILLIVPPTGDLKHDKLLISSFHTFTARLTQTVSHAYDVLRCILLVPGSDANIHSNSYASFALTLWTAWCVVWGGIVAYNFLKATWHVDINAEENDNRSVLERLWTSLSLKNLQSMFKENLCVCCFFYAYPEHELTDCEKVFTKKEIRMTEQLVDKLVTSFGKPRLLLMLEENHGENSEGVIKEDQQLKDGEKCDAQAQKWDFLQKQFCKKDSAAKEECRQASSDNNAMASKVAEETNELEHDLEMIDIETIYGPSNKDDAWNLCSTKQGSGEDKDSEGTDFELVNNSSQSEKLSNSLEVKPAKANKVKKSKRRNEVAVCEEKRVENQDNDTQDASSLPTAVSDVQSMLSMMKKEVGKHYPSCQQLELKMVLKGLRPT